MPRSRLSGGRGFSLIEMLIVGALIALFAGLAMFAAQHWYNENRRKAMFDECKSIGTSLSLSHDDISFFPRLYLLDLPVSMIFINGFARPGFDTYGYYNTAAPVSSLLTNWKGPYTKISSARSSMYPSGGHGLCKMRLSDSGWANLGINTNDPNNDPSLVNWPTDTWGTPYAIYQVKSDTNIMSPTNPKGLRLVSGPAEEGDYFTAVVSYGPNRVPGGTGDMDTHPSESDQAAQLLKCGLFIKGDSLHPGQPPSAAVADYTLRSISGGGDASLSNQTFITNFAQSIESAFLNDPTKIGIQDPGSDDIFWAF